MPVMSADKYLISTKLVTAGRYRKKDSFGTSRTREKRRPDRTDVVPVQKLNNVTKDNDKQ